MEAIDPITVASKRRQSSNIESKLAPGSFGKPKPPYCVSPVLKVSGVTYCKADPELFPFKFIDTVLFVEY